MHYISPGTVSKIFHKWLDILFYRLSKIIEWPEREQLIETTPLSFRRLCTISFFVSFDSCAKNCDVFRMEGYK